MADPRRSHIGRNHSTKHDLAAHGSVAAAGAGDAIARARADASLLAPPRPVTTGGNSFPLEPPQIQLAHIDWFAFSVTPPDGLDLSWLCRELAVLLSIPVFTPTGKGWFGYAHRIDLGGFGLLAHGGESQRGSFHVELNASGCARVGDWHRVREWGEANKAVLTRLDLAHDDLEGRTLSIDTARGWLDDGLFSANGRPPDASLVDDLGSGKGKTLYVGNRKSGKLCRVYEKGRQLGDPASPWVRVEVEWRNKGRVIPWDALDTPGRYLAGAYPCLNFLSEAQEKIRTITKAVTVSLARAVHHARQMVGKLVNVLMQSHSGDAFAVVGELKRAGIPRRLENYADFLPQILEGAPA